MNATQPHAESERNVRHASVRIDNTSQGTALAIEARVAGTAWTRLVGLLGRSLLPPGEALVLEPCRAVHTAFMRFAIDVVFVDRRYRIVKLAPALKPFRMSGRLLGDLAAIELPSGAIAESRSAVGDQLVLTPSHLHAAGAATGDAAA